MKTHRNNTVSGRMWTINRTNRSAKVKNAIAFPNLSDVPAEDARGVVAIVVLLLDDVDVKICKACAAARDRSSLCGFLSAESIAK